jgi:hypothetical protein
MPVLLVASTVFEKPLDVTLLYLLTNERLIVSGETFTREFLAADFIEIQYR